MNFELKRGACKHCQSAATFMCQRCREFYCSISCQIIDWPIHKNTCMPMPQLMPISTSFQTLRSPNVQNTSMNSSFGSIINQNINNNAYVRRQQNYTIATMSKIKTPSSELYRPKSQPVNFSISCTDNRRSTKVLQFNEYFPNSDCIDHNSINDYFDYLENAKMSNHVVKKNNENINLANDKKLMQLKIKEKPFIENTLNTSKKINNNNYMENTLITTASTIENFIDNKNEIIKSKLSSKSSTSTSTKGANKWKTQFPLNYQSDNNCIDVIIQYIVPDNSGIYWVTQNTLDKECNKLLREINKTAIKNSNCLEDEICIDHLYAVPFEGLYYRGTVLNVIPKSVSTTGIQINKFKIRLIDYGNEFYCCGTEFKPAIPLMNNLNAFAFPIRYKNQSAKLKLEIGQIITIKILARDYNHDTINEIFNVEEAPANYNEVLNEDPKFALTTLKPPTSSLEKIVELYETNKDKSTYLIRKSMVTPNLVICLLIDKCTKTAYTTLIQHLPKQCQQHEDENNQSYVIDVDKISIGNFVCGKTVNGWERGFVIAKYFNYCVFIGCDSGTIEIIDKIQLIPKEYQHLEYLSVICEIRKILIDEFEFRTTYFNTNANIVTNLIIDADKSDNNNNNNNKPIKCILEIDNIKMAECLLKKRLFTFEELNIPYWSIIPQGPITFYLTSIYTDLTLNICPINKTNYLKQFINEYIENCTNAKLLNTIPNINDLLLYTIEKEYYRGLVLENLPNNNIKIVNIDNGVIDKCKLKDCRKITNFLRYAPVYTFKVSLQNVSYKKAISNNNLHDIIGYLENLKLRKIKFNINFYSSYKNLVELLFDDTKKSMNKYLYETYIKIATPATSIKSLSTSTLTLNKSQSTIIVPNNIPQNTSSLPHLNNTINNNNNNEFYDDDNVIKSEIDSEIARTKTASSNKLKPSSDIINDNKIILLTDIELLQIKTGENIDIYILDTSNLQHGFITACDYNVNKIQEMDHYIEKINNYCNTNNQEYKPILNEICFGIYSYDNNWYRANCMEVLGENEYLMMFLDYGNIVQINCKNIRKITTEFLYPSNANTCLFNDVPEMTPLVIKKIQDFLGKHPIFNVDHINYTEDEIYYLQSKQLMQYLIAN